MHAMQIIIYNISVKTILISVKCRREGTLYGVDCHGQRTAVCIVSNKWFISEKCIRRYFC